MPTEETARLRTAVLNQCGDNLCWIKETASAAALPEAEFLESCRRYRAQIANDRGEFSSGMTIAQLEAEVERLRMALSGIEICICPAVIDPITGEIVRGQRHAGPMAMIWSSHVSPPRILDAHQGFITSANQFVSREEGLRIQKAAGILSANTETGEYTSDSQLFSEDLYGGKY